MENTKTSNYNNHLAQIWLCKNYTKLNFQITVQQNFAAPVLEDVDYKGPQEDAASHDKYQSLERNVPEARRSAITHKHQYLKLTRDVKEAAPIPIPSQEVKRANPSGATVQLSKAASSKVVQADYENLEQINKAVASNTLFQNAVQAEYENIGALLQQDPQKIRTPQLLSPEAAADFSASNIPASKLQFTKLTTAQAAFQPQSLEPLQIPHQQTLKKVVTAQIFQQQPHASPNPAQETSTGFVGTQQFHAQISRNRPTIPAQGIPLKSFIKQTLQPQIPKASPITAQGAPTRLINAQTMQQQVLQTSSLPTTPLTPNTLQAQLPSASPISGQGTPGIPAKAHTNQPSQPQFPGFSPVSARRTPTRPITAHVPIFQAQIPGAIPMGSPAVLAFQPQMPDTLPVPVQTTTDAAQPGVVPISAQRAPTSPITTHAPTFQAQIPRSSAVPAQGTATKPVTVQAFQPQVPKISPILAPRTLRTPTKLVTPQVFQQKSPPTPNLTNKISTALISTKVDESHNGTDESNLRVVTGPRNP
ncbi:hypothetical protein NECAME_03642 [Necator americanus]|uniref:Uncharacterized protein n=1 Tax=Necator americanus TaxID=51031 RepID=W2T2T1_NECAM|nr:hypothetical protein NECAME_03642 [Necator americanus]ETN75869.1 hypothetical protein NECAME_03642 [Necator americanus]